MRALSLVTLLLVSPAAAQSILAVTESPSEDVWYYGDGVAIVGDTNGDGVADYAVGAYPGSHVYVHDGADSSVILDIEAAPLGVPSVIDGSDLDGDGLADMAVAYPGVDKVRLFSGLDGTQLQVWKNVPSRSMSIVGDVDGDAMPDVLISGVIVPTELAQLRSGATSQILYEHVLPAGWNDSSVAGPGDLNSDGVPDYAVGVPGDDSLAELGGAVDVHSGADGSLLWHAAGDKKMHQLGSSLTAMGDVNLDGVPDLAAGAPGPNAIGYVLILSGLDGAGITGIFDLSGSGSFGARISGTGDATGDGHPDLLVSATSSLQGHVHLVDGLTAGIVWTFTASTQPGYSQMTGLDSGADLNGDGAVDFVAAWASEPGEAFLVSTVDLPWEVLGQALAGTDGKPALRAEGPLTAGSLATLRVAQAQPSTPAWLIAGFSALEAPFKGGTLVPSPDVLLPLTTDDAGKIVLSGAWPPSVPAAFMSWFQAWIIDAAGPQGWSATNALLAESP